MHEGCATKRLAVNDIEMHLRTGGTGPPWLLLPGYPQTPVMWHKVAPVLAEDCTVVVPDLCGYGDSAKVDVEAFQTACSRNPLPSTPRRQPPLASGAGCGPST